jgi:RNA polymerase sigma-70 factor (ECF subfamily)
MITAVRLLPIETQEEAVRDIGVSEVWSREEFQRAVRPLFPPLLRLCRTLADSPEAAEDLLQNALVKAFQHRSSYRAEAPLLGWLYGIVRNEHMDQVRHTARRRGLVRDALERFGTLFEDWFGNENGPNPLPNPERSLEMMRDTESVLATVRALPEPYRSVVWLCDIEELSYQEVSEALSLPLGTVKSRHARGHARLRVALGALAAVEQRSGAGAKALTPDSGMRAKSSASTSTNAGES